MLRQQILCAAENEDWEGIAFAYEVKSPWIVVFICLIILMIWRLQECGNYYHYADPTYSLEEVYKVSTTLRIGNLLLNLCKIVDGEWKGVDNGV